MVCAIDFIYPPKQTVFKKNESKKEKDSDDELVSFENGSIECNECWKFLSVISFYVTLCNYAYVFLWSDSLLLEKCSNKYLI